MGLQLESGRFTFGVGVVAIAIVVVIVVDVNPVFNGKKNNG